MSAKPGPQKADAAARPEGEVERAEQPEAAAPKAQDQPQGEAKAQADTAKEFFGELIKLKAEFENYRKRVDRERPDLIQAGRAGVLDKLLPLYDVLLQAHEQVAKSHGDGPSKDIVKGLELIFKEFSKVFESEGVKPIETVGKPYNYDQHEAMGYVETDRHPEGTIAEEIQRGYTLKGKVLRAARVRIAKAPAAKPAAGGGEDLGGSGR